jgi:nitrilase
MTEKTLLKSQSAPVDAPVTVAVAQLGSVLGDNAATLARMERMAQQAASQQASLIVFPEALLGGYPKGMDFGASVGIRTPKGRSLFADYAACAVERDDATYRAVANLAATHKLFLLTGMLEKEGGTLYCSVVLFSPSGNVLNHRRKLMPTAQERVIWGQGDGDGLEVATTSIGRIGSAICWENYMPLLRMALYQQQVEIYVTPTVDDRPLWQPTLQHIAREGRCFVLSPCQYLTQDDYPDAWRPANLPSPPIRGGSCILSPMGEYIVAPVYDKEALLVATLDRRAITEGKYDLDVAGHYARPDIFTFRW